MKTATAAAAMIAALMNASAAFAAPAREDNSGIVVWIFLAFCALIVVAQVIPAVMMLIGAARSIAPAPKEEAVE